MPVGGPGVDWLARRDDYTQAAKCNNRTENNNNSVADADSCPTALEKPRFWKKSFQNLQTPKT